MAAKQIRFAKLVETSGRPHAATLWVDDPDKDPEFKKAIEENRVVTLHQINVGTKKDYGHIGFHKGPHSNYLIFPKALSMDVGTRVIGVKYEELADASVKDTVKSRRASTGKSGGRKSRH
jgi:hypothetical protein